LKVAQEFYQVHEDEAVGLGDDGDEDDEDFDPEKEMEKASQVGNVINNCEL
jgi:hypothetical protein